MDQREERLRTLYIWARPRVIAYALRRTTCAEDAADIVAETFAVAWRRLEDVPEGNEAMLWLFVTARNLLANESRRDTRRARLIARMGEVLTEFESVVEPPGEATMLAVAALRALSEEDRELLMLSGWDGLDATAAGAVLGCSAGAARIRLHRARKRLATVIADLSNDDGSEKRPAVLGHEIGEATAIGFLPEEG